MPTLADLGAATCGVWTRAAALRVLTGGQVDRLVRDGEWQRPWRGVYADAGHVLDAEQRAHAAILASGGESQNDRDADGRLRLRAVAARRTAARLYAFPLVDDDDPATGREEQAIDDVVVWSHLRTTRAVDERGRPRELRRHRARLAAGEVQRKASGLWAVSPARTLFDLAGDIADEALVCAMDDALHRRVLGRADLEATWALHRRERYADRFRRAVDLADERAESPGETLTRLLLLPALPGLVPQVHLLDHAARPLARVDLGDEARRFAVEFDGRVGHEGQAMVAKDRRRDAGTGRYGWWTERVTWFDVRCRPEQTRRRVVQAAEAHQRRPPVVA
jgi:hypothetical protein